MARPLRIEFEGAWYHVMNRGANRQNIFLNDYDYQYFLTLLYDCREMWGLETHGFCLMPNHYHLLAHTPHANLSRAIRHLNGVYTQHFNKSNRRDGSLFRGRYKSILVDQESYLLQVARYIHLNPVKAGLVVNPEDFPWSSYRFYVSDNIGPRALRRDVILDQFGKGWEALAKLKEFTEAGIDEKLERFYQRQRPGSILANQKFLDWIKQKGFLISGQEKASAINKEAPPNKAPSLNYILSVVSQAYEVSLTQVKKLQRGTSNEPRDTAIYLSRKLTGLPLSKIAHLFGCCRQSAISNAISRLGKQMNRDQGLRERVETIKKTMNANQRTEDVAVVQM